LDLTAFYSYLNFKLSSQLSKILKTKNVPILIVLRSLIANIFYYRIFKNVYFITQYHLIFSLDYLKFLSHALYNYQKKTPLFNKILVFIHFFSFFLSYYSHSGRQEEEFMFLYFIKILNTVRRYLKKQDKGKAVTINMFVCLCVKKEMLITKKRKA
jgi:hypothetical protein